MIIAQLRREQKVYVAQLSRTLNVTEETIRRDLKVMEQKGIIIREHGGATLNKTSAIKPFTERERINYEKKSVIADLVQDLIIDGMSIMVDASTTTKLVIERISPDKQLTIITNSFTLINELMSCPNLKFIATGGECSGPYKAYVGSDALNTISHYNVDLAILSCHSATLTEGYMESNQLEGDVKRAMARQAASVIEVADQTKLNRRSFCNVLGITEADCLVTDHAPDATWIDFFRQRKLRLIYPEKSKA